MLHLSRRRSRRYCSTESRGKKKKKINNKISFVFNIRSPVPLSSLFVCSIRLSCCSICPKKASPLQRVISLLSSFLLLFPFFSIFLKKEKHFLFSLLLNSSTWAWRAAGLWSSQIREPLGLSYNMFARFLSALLAGHLFLFLCVCVCCTPLDVRVCARFLLREKRELKYIQKNDGRTHKKTKQKKIQKEKYQKCQAARLISVCVFCLLIFDGLLFT